MKDDYLFDGQGEPDPEVAELEAMLGGLRYEGELPELPARETAPARRRRWPWVAMAVAAVAVITLNAVAWMAAQPWIDTPPDDIPDEVPEDPASWHVATVTGTVCGEQDCAIRAGEWLETDEASSARVAVADIGFLDVAPSTRLRLKATGPDEHRLELAQGRIDAMVVAPPRLLVVETPAATAVDLGCAYTLEVDDEGAGYIHVTSGWVALETPGREVIVPAGARADTKSGRGPGTPYFTDAPDALVAALRAFDGHPDDPDRVDAVLATARPRDTLSLWHLLPVVEKPARQRVLDQIQSLQPAVSCDNDLVLAADPVETTALFDQLYARW